MKTTIFLNLIKSHFSKDDTLFEKSLNAIAADFDAQGETRISKMIREVLSENTKVTKSNTGSSSIKNIQNIKLEESKLEENYVFPESILNELKVIVRFSQKIKDPNKIFLFGNPGTGKTSFAKIISNKLKKDLITINFNSILSSYLGETSKNVESLFNEFDFSKSVLFFDEVDSVVSNRKNVNSEEIYRATISFMNQLDKLSGGTIIVATNMVDNIDEAIKRRFNFLVNFNTYTKEDINKVIELYFEKFSILKKERKILTEIFLVEIDNLLPSKIESFLKKYSLAEDYDEKSIMINNEFDFVRNISNIELSKKHAFSANAISLIKNEPLSSVYRKVGKHGQ